MQSSQIQPLLKWVGGKRQLLPALRRFYPASFRRYVEPFFGSGAVFFDLWSQGRLAGHPVVLIDSNPDLIGCYESVRDQPEAVAAELDRLAEAHTRDPRGTYYEVRDDRFNPQRASRRCADGRIAYTPALAAMLIYLNRTGYNGLFRLNARGGFNVPAGRYAKVTICDAPNLRRLSAALRRPGLTVEVRRFEEALAEGQAGDFVYLDPPYAPVSRTAQFTSYTAAKFGADAQARLQQAVVRLARTGASVLLSNSVAPDIRRLYEKDADARAAGLKARKVDARRAINSKASARGAVREYLITNIV
jgi:DNA adenine methylase